MSSLRLLLDRALAAVVPCTFVGCYSPSQPAHTSLTGRDDTNPSATESGTNGPSTGAATDGLSSTVADVSGMTAADSTGPGETTVHGDCEAGVCCPGGKPLDGTSCGVGCQCMDGHARELVCLDGTDNDNDGSFDCADDECAGATCDESATIEFVATGDTWVGTFAPDANENVLADVESTLLEHGGYYMSGSEFETYLEFADVNPTAGIEVIGAVLEVYVYDVDDGTHDRANTGSFQIIDAWHETSLTWNGSHTGSMRNLLADEPSDTILVGDITPLDGIADPLTPQMEWYAYDVTSIVASWVDGSSVNFGVAIAPIRDEPTDTASNNVLFAYSKAYVDARLHPRLTIQYRAVCTPAGTCATLE